MIPDKETRCTVMGLGRFGGGLGVTRWLLDRGCPVTLTDLADEDALSLHFEQLSDATASGQLRLQLGSHEPRDFIDTDLVIANPAVPLPWNNPFLDLARGNGTRSRPRSRCSCDNSIGEGSSASPAPMENRRPPP